MCYAEEPITLRYAYWGSSYENEAMLNIAAKYEAEHPNVKIECIYIPNADYTTKMTSMIAANDEPDIANLFPSDFIGWARQGMFVNLYEMIENDDRYSVDDYIPNCFFEIEEGYAGGRSIANELLQLYYNKDIFDKYGVDYLPAKPEEALTWEEFVEVLQKLTIDENGNNVPFVGFDGTEMGRQAGVAGAELLKEYGWLDDPEKKVGALIANAETVSVIVQR